MILEAFAEYLHEADPQLPANWILARWLWERLSIPPETTVDKVLHCEIAIVAPGKALRSALSLTAGAKGPTYVFKGNSDSGHKLLRSLWEYSLSYEQQKWSRWVHRVKASDFNQRYTVD